MRIDIEPSSTISLCQNNPQQFRWDQLGALFCSLQYISDSPKTVETFVQHETQPFMASFVRVETLDETFSSVLVDEWDISVLNSELASAHVTHCESVKRHQIGYFQTARTGIVRNIKWCQKFKCYILFLRINQNLHLNINMKTKFRNSQIKRCCHAEYDVFSWFAALLAQMWRPLWIQISPGTPRISLSTPRISHLTWQHTGRKCHS